MSGMRAFIDQHRGAATAITLIFATVLLLAAGFLAMNLLEDGPTAVASSTQAPSSTSTASPPATEPSAPPASGPVGEVAIGRVFAGVVLVNNLRIREEPMDGAVRATLQAGDIVRMQGDPLTLDGSDWYPIQSGTDTYGWVSAGPEGQYLELHRRVAQQVPATVEGVAGGPTGYLAWGVSAGRESEHRDRFVAVSTDGATWRLGPVPAAVSAAAFVAADYGPAGWLLAAHAENSTTAGLWRSADGLSWQAIDANLEPSLGIRSLVGSTSGYLLGVWDYRGGDSRATAFVSRDGRNWSEVDTPSEVYPGEGADADGGFVIWGEQPDAPAFIRYSPDGTTWLDPSRGGMHLGPTDTPIAIAVTGRRFVALTVVQSSGPMKVWTATLPEESDSNWPALEWTRQPSAEAQLAAMAVGRLVALDGRVLAFGNAYDTGEVVAWSTTDGASWEQLAIGALGRTAGLAPMAVGESGLVGVAHDVTAAGKNPRFWHSTNGAAWQGEASPTIKAVEHAVIGACPVRPSTMLDWMAVPGAVGAECFGDEPITFRAWHTVGGGCGGFAPGIFEPGWLASQFAILALELTPNEVEHAGCGTAAVHPGLIVPAAQQWVQVTGHWADSASETCRMLPDPLYPGAPVGGSLVFECRSKFVATALAPSP